jgi:hypothetical protein
LGRSGSGRAAEFAASVENDPLGRKHKIGQCTLLDDIYASEIGRTNARRLFNWKMIEGTFAK